MYPLSTCSSCPEYIVDPTYGFVGTCHLVAIFGTTIPLASKQVSEAHLKIGHDEIYWVPDLHLTQ